MVVTLVMYREPSSPKSWNTAKNREETNEGNGEKGGSGLVVRMREAWRRFPQNTGGRSQREEVHNSRGRQRETRSTVRDAWRKRGP